MNKRIKVNELNTMIRRSSAALERGFLAELLPDGRIQYSETLKSSLGRPYKAKTSFNRILSQLHGNDMRTLKQKYGGKR